MDSNTMYIVKNRSAGMAIYRIPEKGIRREFAPGEVREISGQELIDLSYRPGGRELMTNFLQIQSKEAVEALNIHTEPEYNYSEQDIVSLIKEGSLDAFLDCLDFAPVGVVDLLKSLSVSVPLTDYDKRIALKEKTGFDVDAALKNIALEKAEDETPEASAVRRVKAEETPAPAGRRTTGGYKVVNKTAE